jgi:hypothetical protein
LIRDKEFYIRYRDAGAVIEVWTYEAPKPTISELDAVWEKADLHFRLEAIRSERNKRLLSSDWTHLLDNPLTTEQQKQWADYRRLLREFLDTCDPYNPEWPPEPKANLASA